MVDDIFSYLGNNYIYYILFIFIGVFVFKEGLIKKLEKLVTSQRQLILGQREIINRQEKLITELTQSRYGFCKNDLNDFGEEITPGLLLEIKSMIENDVVANEPAAVFNYGSFSCPEPNPKPKPKKQAKPKKKRK